MNSCLEIRKNNTTLSKFYNLISIQGQKDNLLTTKYKRMSADTKSCEMQVPKHFEAHDIQCKD